MKTEMLTLLPFDTVQKKNKVYWVQNICVSLFDETKVYSWYNNTSSPKYDYDISE